MNTINISFCALSKVAIWDTPTGRIQGYLEHIDIEEGDHLSKVICFKDRAITCTKKGSVNIWDVNHLNEPLACHNFPELLQIVSTNVLSTTTLHM